MVIELILYGFSIASCSNEIAYVCEQTSLFKPAFLLVMSILETPAVCLNSNLTSITRSCMFISVVNQLDAQNFCFTISLFHTSTCFEHMCLSSGGQNCITQPLVSSNLQVAVSCILCRWPSGMQEHILLHTILRFTTNSSMDALPANRSWHPSCSHGTYQHEAITSRSRQLLMMGTWLPETCWANSRREIKNTKVTSS